jgi:hypothetical protein
MKKNSCFILNSFVIAELARLWKFLGSVIIISLPQSTAGHRPLQCLAQCRSIFGYSHPAPDSRPVQIVTPPGLRASYTKFTETRSPIQNSFTPVVNGSTADITSLLPLQHGNTVCYVGDFSSLPDHLLSDSIPQRNPEHSSFHISLTELKLVDQPCRECPRLGTVCHDR